MRPSVFSTKKNKLHHYTKLWVEEQSLLLLAGFCTTGKTDDIPTMNNTLGHSTGCADESMTPGNSYILKLCPSMKPSHHLTFLIHSYVNHHIE
jgi:hypothetical protein